MAIAGPASNRTWFWTNAWNIPTTFPLDQKDPSRMAAIGWNAVRLAVSWKAIGRREHTVAQLRSYLEGKRVEPEAIEAAIAEAREALARDPGSETLARLLVAGHDQKVELLRHATRLATQS